MAVRHIKLIARPHLSHCVHGHCGTSIHVRASAIVFMVTVMRRSQKEHMTMAVRHNVTRKSHQ